MAFYLTDCTRGTPRDRVNKADGQGESVVARHCAAGGDNG